MRRSRCRKLPEERPHLLTDALPLLQPLPKSIASFDPPVVPVSLTRSFSCVAQLPPLLRTLPLSACFLTSCPSWSQFAMHTPNDPGSQHRSFVGSCRMAMCKVLILATSDGTGYTNESASAGGIHT